MLLIFLGVFDKI